MWKVFAAMFALLVLFAAALPALGFYHGRITEYEQADTGKQALYADRNVMVIVPHQDDDINVGGGVIEEYLRYGSQLRMVYTTNGDAVGRAMGERRINEALRVAADMGIAEENVIFLGYGDKWQGNHLYLSEPGETKISLGGESHTYGIASHPAFNDGQEYTKANFEGDIKAVILKYMPDVIICIDQDSHVDHKAASMSFEGVMGEILRENPEYAPLVLKSLAYSMAYYAERDFYSENIAATANPGQTAYVEDVNIYNWSERIRLPVAADGLSRSILGCDNYRQLRMYSSQEASEHAEGIINGDKVFWQRDTDSLSYRAKLEVSSGNAAVLNDFKLLETNDVWIESYNSTMGLWIPDADDREKIAQMIFDEPVDITEIWLYDAPAMDANVLNARISFDDGSVIETGALETNGSATEIKLDKKNVKSFSVKLLETEGGRAGLTEIEVYSGVKDHKLNFIKIMNLSGDFVYDYYIDSSGEESFDLYTGGNTVPLSSGSYSLDYESEICRAEISEGKLSVVCPKGERFILNISSANGEYSDSVVISNPGILRRSFSLWAHDYYHSLQESNSYRLARDAYRLIRYGTTEPVF